GAGRGQRHGAGRGQRHGAGRGQRHGAGRGQRHGAGRGQRHGAGRGQRHGAGRGQRHGAGRGQRHGAGRGQRHGAGRGQRHGAGEVSATGLGEFSATGRPPLLGVRHSRHSESSFFCVLLRPMFPRQNNNKPNYRFAHGCVFIKATEERFWQGSGRVLGTGVELDAVAISYITLLQWSVDHTTQCYNSSEMDHTVL
uniref:Uncharacterized protein n=1 Tax=Salmo trutta TaxID=8032 RepID=A0A674D7Z4_SALTR